jgi:hypothetical protein
MKKIIRKNKIVIILSAFIFVFAFIFIASPSIKLKSAGYAVQYGGRIASTMPPTVCSNPYTSSACPLCGPGYWYQVVVQPSGGSGFYFCPTFEATKGNNPTYLAGGYVITGGSSPNVLDPSNTAAVIASNKIKGNFMLALFKLLDIFS